MFTDHVSREGKVIGNAPPSVCLSVRPSVRPFVSDLSYEPTGLELEYLRVHGS